MEQNQSRKHLDSQSLLEELKKTKPVFWLNPNRRTMKETANLPLDRGDLEEAAQLWQRFAPFLAEAFPETKQADGIIESPLRAIGNVKKKFEGRSGKKLHGDFFLKCDSELPIAGSIKARGGVYEVLYYAEKLALEKGLLTKGESYKAFASEQFRQFFSQYKIGVGSTGNLGLSIGIIGAKLGFHVSVYMSADAKQWKKDLLRKKGAEVVEFSGDFSEAIAAGRRQTEADPSAYFVDDESSKQLFLGYSVAALRLEKQLKDNHIQVDADHPLFVYLPCGVGGAPGGITFGLKQVFGDHVHCFFAEPTHAPAMLVGLLTGKMNKICVQDLGLDNRTEADGLAVGRPSGFASPICSQLVSGIYTMEDEELFELLALLADAENLWIEPSAAAGLAGPIRLKDTQYMELHGLDETKATHIAWSTGGLLVPETDMEAFYRKGKSLLQEEGGK